MALLSFVEQDGMWALVRERVNKLLKPGRRVAMVALFEFKCPHRWHPKGFVPRHYLPQVWAGLDISPFANIGLFCEMVARKCSKAEFSVWGGVRHALPFWPRLGAWDCVGRVWRVLPRSKRCIDRLRRCPCWRVWQNDGRHCWKARVPHCALWVVHLWFERYRRRRGICYGWFLLLEDFLLWRAHCKKEPRVHGEMHAADLWVLGSCDSSRANNMHSTTSRVISRTCLCHSGVKQYSLTRNAAMWKQTIMFKGLFTWRWGDPR